MRERGALEWIFAAIGHDVRLRRHDGRLRARFGAGATVFRRAGGGQFDAGGKHDQRRGGVDRGIGDLRSRDVYGGALVGHADDLQRRGRRRYVRGRRERARSHDCGHHSAVGQCTGGVRDQRAVVRRWGGQPLLQRIVPDAEHLQ